MGFSATEMGIVPGVCVRPAFSWLSTQTLNMSLSKLRHRFLLVAGAVVEAISVSSCLGDRELWTVSDAESHCSNGALKVSLIFTSLPCFSSTWNSCFIFLSMGKEWLEVVPLFSDPETQSAGADLGEGVKGP